MVLVFAIVVSRVNVLPAAMIPAPPKTSLLILSASAFSMRKVNSTVFW